MVGEFPGLTIKNGWHRGYIIDHRIGAPFLYEGDIFGLARRGSKSEGRHVEKLKKDLPDLRGSSQDQDDAPCFAPGPAPGGGLSRCEAR